MGKYVLISDVHISDSSLRLHLSWVDTSQTSSQTSDERTFHVRRRRQHGDVGRRRVS